jgi:hypothetical protein
MSNAWEQFQCATLSLAQDGTIKHRLAEAYLSHLAGLEEGDIPADLREEFRTLSAALRRERPVHKRENPVHATIRKMSNEEAENCAVTVVKIFGALSKPATAIRGTDLPASVVQLFAVER